MLYEERPFVYTKDPHTVNILIVDDNQAFAESLVAYLSKKGYLPTFVNTGADALEATKRSQFEIAILDLKLPDIDGIALLEAIRKKHEQMIIILISGYATIDAAAKSIQRGAYDFISKPFEFIELEVILQRALEKKEMTAKLKRARIRNTILALSLPLWVLLGYLLVNHY
jgi:two-component system NtrC family response regulator